MDALIEKINKIQDQFRALREDPIELPQIVVVGSQSTGKSSVLESLVRRSFLPRGSGIVTRCPLILQLHRCPLDDRRRPAKGTRDIEEWGEFLHDDEKIYQIDQIREEIEAETSRLAGSSKNICSDPITLKIFSPNVLNLTLVDLPGLTKVPVGDQPKDIEQKTRAMIHHFIDNPLSIILAVVTANVDMATNDSLQLAQMADPDGSRTLAVVTKLDLMDKGTDAYDILTGRLIPVKLGIIGVVNRSQHDINNNKTIDDCLKDEVKFLAENYPELATKNGTPYLAQRLRQLLMEHIKTCLPGVKDKVKEQIRECEDVLAKCGDTVMDEKTTLTKLISEFSDMFSSMLEAGFLDIKAPVLLGGAKVCYIFDKLKSEFDEVDPCQTYSLEEVIMAIRNSNGPRPPFFVSEPAFEALVKPLIKNLNTPSIDCVTDVIKELESVCKLSIPHEAYVRFPQVKQEMIMVVDNLIEECSVKTKEMVQDSVKIELSHITYRHFNQLKDQLVARMHGGTSGNDNDGNNGDKDTPAEQPVAPKPGVQGVKKEKRKEEKKKGKEKGKRVNRKQGNGQVVLLGGLLNNQRLEVVQFRYFDDENDSQEKKPTEVPFKKDPKFLQKISKQNLKDKTKLSSMKKEENLQQFDKKLLVMSDRDEEHIIVLGEMLVLYYKMVSDKIQDTVAKSVMTYLVNKVKSQLNVRLATHLFKDDVMGSLFEEEQSVTTMRRDNAAKLKVLKASFKVLNSIADEN